jgi:hypothetical protein
MKHVGYLQIAQSQVRRRFESHHRRSLVQLRKANYFNLKTEGKYRKTMYCIAMIQKSGAVCRFFTVLQLIALNYRDYTQVLWITLCINCYIGRLATVFITVLSDRTKTRQSTIFIYYQLVKMYIFLFLPGPCQPRPVQIFFCVQTKR